MTNFDPLMAEIG